MSVVSIAIVIVAAFVAAVVRYAALRSSGASVWDAVSLGLALLLFGLILAAGPKVLGG